MKKFRASKKSIQTSLKIRGFGMLYYIPDLNIHRTFDGKRGYASIDEKNRWIIKENNSEKIEGIGITNMWEAIRINFPLRNR